MEDWLIFKYSLKNNDVRSGLSILTKIQYAASVEGSEILAFFKNILLFHVKNYALRKFRFINTEKFYGDLK